MATTPVRPDYDRRITDPLIARYYDYSDFFNFGYWTPDTRSQKQASEALVEKLLSFLPEKQGTILDVACGLGASTRLLLRHYRPEEVTAINLSEPQLERARRNAPGCRFLFMDAARLEFPDESFDNILCVEAAFLFDSRDQFYREALRVLKPGGRVVTSDILFAGWFPHKVKPNRILTPQHLGDRIRGLGFDSVQIEDATQPCWGGFRASMRRAPGLARRAGELTLSQYVRGAATSFFYAYLAPLIFRYYVLTSARKPLSAGSGSHPRG